MTDAQRLERGYRAILALYPRAFRRESEEEILAVLIASAREGQRRVGPAEAADLIRGALRMHRGPRLPRALRIAVRLTYVCAVVELAVLITVLVTLASLTSASIRGYPDFSAGQWHAVLLAHRTAVEFGAPVLLGLWAWMACANARGHHAARVTSRVVYAIITIGVVAQALAGIPVYGIGGVIADAVLIEVQLAALVLTLNLSKKTLPHRPHRRLDLAQR
jgi:hypothetical protein